MRTVVSALITFIALTSAAFAQERSWFVSGLYGDIIAIDCVDCGDDIGMTLSCQGVGSSALVRVPFAATQRFPGSNKTLVARADGQEFGFEASFEEQGLVGFVPLFELPANHPLIDALARGTELQIAVGEAVTYIGLNGSKQAMEIFRAHCGWTQMPPYVGEVAPRDVAASEVVSEPIEDEARWYIQQSANEDGAETVALTFGIPGTDAVLFSTSCDTGVGTRNAEVSLSIDFGSLQGGDSAQVDFNTYSGQFSYPGKVFIDSEESAGVRLTVGARAPLWRALASAKSISFGVSGGPTVTIPRPDTEGVVKSFVESCFSSESVPTPAKPLQKPMQPKVSGPSDSFSLDQPAGDRPDADGNDSADDAKVPVASVAPASDGDTRVFVCPDDTELRLTITGTAPKRVADLVVGSNPPERLTELPAGANVLFAGANVTLFVKDDAVQIVQRGVKSDCRED